MTKHKLFELYLKERDYQRTIFGNYENNPYLNFASFLLFINEYLEKIKKKYALSWEKPSDFPSWFKGSSESENDNPAPVEAYEALIKLHALTGAAIESYLNVDVEEWRSEGIKSKWRENG